MKPEEEITKEQYGCPNNKFADERFECMGKCGYKMEDGKCGKLTGGHFIERTPNDPQ